MGPRVLLTLGLASWLWRAVASSGLAPRQLQQVAVSFNDSTLDDPAQRQALMAVYDATSGPSWSWVASASSSGVGLWGQANISYCSWLGVTCCAASALRMVPCRGDRSVVTLSMENFGMQGSLPEQLGNLYELTALGLSGNPQLNGSLPSTMGQLTQLLWLSATVRSDNSG